MNQQHRAAANGNEKESALNNNCIGNLEHHVHKVFASVRVPGEDFVYSASMDLFSKLDDYCDDQFMSESRLPLLIKGESGTGKSALLSNWLQRRERNSKRARNAISDEFVFWHAVGCSRQSMNVNSLIRRLIVDLKNRFELTRPIPASQERLSWELPRFFDLVSKRAGNVIIVIDGLNRLVNNDNTEDALTWLPLEFPPHIRVILSVTIPAPNPLLVNTYVTEIPTNVNSPGMGGAMNRENSQVSQTHTQESDQYTPFSSHQSPSIAKNNSHNSFDNLSAHSAHSNELEDEEQEEPAENAAETLINKKNNPLYTKKSRILQELERRKIPFFVLKPLDKTLCRSLVETFIQMTANNESASLATVPSSTFITGGEHNQMGVGAGHRASQNDTNQGQVVPGFLLFENQISSLLNHAQGGTPLFLRLFLRCLQYAVSRGYSLWEVYDNWMKANSVPELLIRILQTLEEGAHRHRDSSQEACDKTIAAGGLPALRALYSWHPSFQAMPDSLEMEKNNNHAALEAWLRSRTGATGGAAAEGGNETAPSPVLLNNNRRPPSSQQLDLLKSATGGAQSAGGFPQLTVSVGDNQNQNKIKTAGNASNPLSTSVAQNLGDQQWVSVTEAVDKKLEDAMTNAHKLIDDTLAAAKQSAVENNTDYVTALVVNIKMLHKQYAENREREAERGGQPGNRRSTSRPRTASLDMSVSTRGDGEGFVDAADEDNYTATVTDDSDADSLEDGSNSLANSPNVRSKKSAISSRVHSPSFADQQQYQHGNISEGGPSFSTPTKGKSGPFDLTRAQGTRGSQSSVNPNSSAVKAQPVPVDPSEGLTSLPLYLRGGITTAGFGEILGNALALLYVSRQGLRESELWKILGTLQHKKERSHKESFESKEMRAVNDLIIRTLSTQVLNSRGELRDIFKSDDTSHTGYITTKQLHLGIKKLHPSTKKIELLKLLEFIEINTQTAPDKDATQQLNNTGTPHGGHTGGHTGHHFEDAKINALQVGNKVHYERFLSLLVKLNKHFKFGETKVSNMKSNGQSAAPSTFNLMKQSANLKKKVSASATSIGVATGNEAPAPSTVEEEEYNHFNQFGNPSVDLGTGGNPSQTSSSHSRRRTNLFLDQSNAAGPQGGSQQTPPPTTLLMGTHEDDDEDDAYTLGPVIEESLLSILSALGVLYSPENKVLILPSDSEPFRKVILQEYILNRGGRSLHYWHHLIIQYFQTEPNTLRKCEELPWHLKICKKWNTLRDTLVDLKTFDLMFHNDLKDELLQYWLLLTEGPLYVNDPHAHPPREKSSSGNLRSSFMGAMGGTGSAGAGGTGTLGGGQGGGNETGHNSDEEDNVSTYSHILREIDSAMDQKISVKDARKKLFKHQIQPFDVVEELNKSLETWVHTARPSPAQIHRTITQISKFLAEFSKLMRSTPTFSRIGIDLAALQRFGVSLDDIKDIMGQSNSSAAVSAHDLGAEDGGAYGSPQRQGTMKSLALSDTAEKDKYFEGTSKTEAPQFPTEAMVASKLYPYLRWIWMQFPWIALHPASYIMAEHLGDNHSSSLDGTHDKSDNNLNDTANGGPHAAINSDNARLLRVWNVKKSDPTVPVFETSMNRKLAAIKPRTSLSKSMERNVEVSCKALYEELTAPSHIAKVKLGRGINKDRYRRSYEEDVEQNKNIPFAYHGARITKAGSLFPSYDAHIRETNRKKLEFDLNKDDQSLDSAGHVGKKGGHKVIPKFNLQDALSGGGTKNADTGGFFLTELDSEIQRISNEEYVQQHKVERAGGAVIKDENDLEYEASLDRIARMKTIRNKLDIIKRTKMNMITDLDNQIMLRNESDALLISEVNASELLIKSLNERNILMDQNMVEAKQLNDGYQELLKALKNNPPYIESHVQSLEIEVELAEKQFADLCAHRSNLYEEAQRLDTVKRKQLQERIAYYKDAIHEVQVKKKQVQREIKHLKDPHSSDHDGAGRKSRQGKRSGRRKHDDDSADNSVNSYDSDRSEEEEKVLELTKPVIHFINALVRKSTYGEGIVKETDKSLEDIKARAKKGEDKAASKVEKAIQHGRKRTIRQQNREMEVIINDGNALLEDGGWDQRLGLPATQVPFGGSVAFQQAQHNGGHVNVAAQQMSIIGKRRFSKEQHSAMKESLKSLTVSLANNRGGANTLGIAPGLHQNAAEKESFRVAVQKTITYLFEKTESTNADEFIERFNHGQKLLETMKNQQVLVDNKLTQLQAEHHELYSTWSEITFMTEDGEKVNPAGGAAATGAETRPTTANTTGPDDNNLSFEEGLEEDRYLDNQLFKKEVEMHKNQRRYENSVHIISEVQTSVAHIMNNLVINARLLQALPKSKPPELKKDSDIIKCIGWCEDRIMALNEALTMDANRPTGASAPDESKPMSQRQIELAELILEMQKTDRKHRSVGNKGPKKIVGGLSKTLINTGDKNTFVSSPRAIMITPMNKVDRQFDSKMDKVLVKRDKREDAYELSSRYDSKKDNAVDVQRFLADGLDKVTTKELSRQANLLQNKRQGRHLSYGLVLDGFLKESGQSMEKTTDPAATSANLNEPSKMSVGHHLGETSMSTSKIAVNVSSPTNSIK